MEGHAPKGFPANTAVKTQALLELLDAADELDMLRHPPGNRLEKLTGNRKGQHSLRVNAKWRLCFRWTNEGAEDVEFVDYH
ncbi:MAG: type II toxin-antitoxin system RelE/ParE family toxin [Ahrensia sp.]|nr:type II toxin-antitoxin system RelE/ParE family toxin [Ahrensia sp.]